MGQATRDNPKAQRLGSGSNQFFHTDIELDITFRSLELKPFEESPKIIDPFSVETQSQPWIDSAGSGVNRQKLCIYS